MKSKLNFAITMHARKRFLERIALLRRTRIEQHLEQPKNVKVIDSRIYEDLRNAIESDEPFKDKNLFEYFSKNYGLNIKFFESNKVIYVINNDNGKNLVVTCYDKKGYVGYLIKGW